MDKIDYLVTERAGAFVAGMRSPGAGKRLALTEEQAAYALQAGELKLPPAAEPKPSTASKPSKARAEPAAPAGD